MLERRGSTAIKAQALSEGSFGETPALLHAHRNSACREDLVFCREDGTSLDRWHVQKEFRKITKTATVSGCSAMAGGWWSSVYHQPRPRSASRRSGFITTKSSSPGRWLSFAASARPGGGYRTAAASPACWPRSGTSRSDQHFVSVLVTLSWSPILVSSPISVSRPLRRRYRGRTAHLGSKPRSVLVPGPAGGLGRGPGCDLVAFGERPGRLDARAGGRRPGRPAVMIAPAGPV